MQLGALGCSLDAGRLMSSAEIRVHIDSAVYCRITRSPWQRRRATSCQRPLTVRESWGGGLCRARGNRRPCSCGRKARGQACCTRAQNGDSCWCMPQFVGLSGAGVETDVRLALAGWKAGTGKCKVRRPWNPQLCKVWWVGHPIVANCMPSGHGLATTPEMRKFW